MFLVVTPRHCIFHKCRAFIISAVVLQCDAQLLLYFVVAEEPSKFTKWYMSIFPALNAVVKDNELKYQDVMTILSTHAVDSSVRATLLHRVYPLRPVPVPVPVRLCLLL